MNKTLRNCILLSLVFLFENCYSQSSARDLFEDNEILLGATQEQVKNKYDNKKFRDLSVMPYLGLKRVGWEDWYEYKKNKQSALEFKFARKEYYFRTGVCDSVVFGMIRDSDLDSLLKRKYVLIKKDSFPPSTNFNFTKIVRWYNAEPFTARQIIVTDNSKFRRERPQIYVVFTNKLPH